MYGNLLKFALVISILFLWTSTDKVHSIKSIDLDPNLSDMVIIYIMTWFCSLFSVSVTTFPCNISLFHSKFNKLIFSFQPVTNSAILEFYYTVIWSLPLPWKFSASP